MSAWMAGVGGSLIFIRGVGLVADLISFTEGSRPNCTRNMIEVAFMTLTFMGL